MKKIEIEDDLYKYILANIESFGETPSQILRRLLSLPRADNKVNESSLNKAPTVKETSDAVDTQVDSAVVHASSNISLAEKPLAEPVAHGVEALFSDEKFKQEVVVTNKFKMMLTAMYHENKAGFITAANTTKGRTRDYFGQNLSALLDSDNQQEVELLKASKPHNIPNTPFWVITNANTGRKRIILTQMMTTMGYPERLIARIKEEI